MRLWHVDLIPYLPRQQLLSQWRECVCIAKNLAEKGTPNHILVNKILYYPCRDFNNYTTKVIEEIKRRGYKVSDKTLSKFNEYYKIWKRKRLDFRAEIDDYPFCGWHNKRYLEQCFYNLYEKYDCGAVPYDEFQKFKSGYEKLMSWEK